MKSSVGFLATHSTAEQKNFMTSSQKWQMGKGFTSLPSYLRLSIWLSLFSVLEFTS
jgi:hypothetical protein